MSGSKAVDPVLPCAPEEVDGFLSAPPEAVVAAVGRMKGEFMVLGAAGKMGLHLCLMLRRALDARKDPRRVIAVSRFSKAGSRDEFESKGIRTVPCDLCDEAQLAGLETVPNIIFMAGAKFGTSDRPNLLRLMNEEMPARVARRFAGCAITAFSTGCVYSFEPVESRGSNEDSPTNPIGEYAQSCLGREQAFVKQAGDGKTRVALIRLNYSVEFRYGVPIDIARKVLAGEPVDVTMGHVNLIWQRDAVAQTILAHELAENPPFVINITGPETLRVRDIAAQLGRLLGRAPKIVGEEEPTAWISDASRSHRLFGKPETDYSTMMQWIAAWQLAALPTLNKPTGFEKRDGKF